MGTVKRTVGLRFGEGNEWAILCVALWRLAALFCICQSLRNGQDQDCDSRWYWCITIGDSKKKKKCTSLVQDVNGRGCAHTGTGVRQAILLWVKTALKMKQRGLRRQEDKAEMGEEQAHLKMAEWIWKGVNRTSTNDHSDKWNGKQISETLHIHFNG